MLLIKKHVPNMFFIAADLPVNLLLVMLSFIFFEKFELLVMLLLS